MTARAFRLLPLYRLQVRMPGAEGVSTVSRFRLPRWLHLKHLPMYAATAHYPTHVNFIV